MENWIIAIGRFLGFRNLHHRIIQRYKWLIKKCSIPKTIGHTSDKNTYKIGRFGIRFQTPSLNRWTKTPFKQGRGFEFRAPTVIEYKYDRFWGRAGTITLLGFGFNAFYHIKVN